MASGKTVLEAVDQLNYRWWNEGVAVRLLECSMTCMSKWKGGRFWQGAEMRRRGGVVRYQISDKDCISPEMSREFGPASMLRWDLPNAIFNGGRCVSPAPYERSDFPAVPARYKSSVTPDGYMVNGFVGHNVTSAGVGWIFGNVPLSARGGAFGHDAWTSDYTRSGTSSTVYGPSTLSQCQTSPDGHGSADYAAARLAARSKTFRDFVPGSAQHRAAAYKWGFVNRTWNCYHGASAWERAFDDQRAYALLVAKRKEELPGECSIWGSLYNQIHFSWKASDLAAIFYVNDTLTPQRAPKIDVAQYDLLLSTALAASRRAYTNALIMQRSVWNRTGQVLPIVQFPIKHENFDGRPLEKRLEDAADGPARRGSFERAYRGVFFTTPEAEAETTTLLKIDKAKKQSRESQIKRSRQKKMPFF